MQKITKKETIETLASAKKIEKLFLPLRLKDKTKEIIEEVKQQALNKLQQNNNTAVIKKSNSLLLNGSYLYFSDMKECYKYNDDINAVIVITNLNIIIYFID